MQIVDNINDWLESYTKNDLFSFIISFTIHTACSEQILLKPNPFMLWNWWQKSFYVLIKCNGDSKRKSSLKSLSFQFKNDTIRNYLFILILMHTPKRLCIKKKTFICSHAYESCTRKKLQYIQYKFCFAIIVLIYNTCKWYMIKYPNSEYNQTLNNSHLWLS